jgi:hypothetical protein
MNQEKNQTKQNLEKLFFRNVKKTDSQGLTLTESLIRGARTGKLACSVRIISIAYVQFFVPGNRKFRLDNRT